MADFALGMVEAMRKVCAANGDVDLSMRVGLHSGTCLAGVLMGERARFQLFGDTVNTASRMESTGVAGRVQVSETTAQLLQRSAQFELQYRGKVDAKGKGTLETYWLLGRVEGQAWEAPSRESSRKQLSPQNSTGTSFLHSLLGRRTASGGSEHGMTTTSLRNMLGCVVVEPLTSADEEHSTGAAPVPPLAPAPVAPAALQ